MRGTKIDWDKIILEKHQAWSMLEEISPEMRSSKMFSKSTASNDFIRPYWFTASIKPSKDALTLNTVLTLKDWDCLIQLAELYEGKLLHTHRQHVFIHSIQVQFQLLY